MARTFESPSTEAELHDIRDLALAKAHELVGDDAVLEAETAEGADLDGDPTYNITMLVKPTLIEQRLGRLGLGRFVLRLSQAIDDVLLARRDPHEVRVRPLNHADWPQRNG